MIYVNKLAIVLIIIWGVLLLLDLLQYKKQKTKANILSGLSDLCFIFAWTVLFLFNNVLIDILTIILLILSTAFSIISIRLKTKKKDI